MFTVAFDRIRLTDSPAKFSIAYASVFDEMSPDAILGGSRNSPIGDGNPSDGSANLELVRQCRDRPQDRTRGSLPVNCMWNVTL
jgi:hypothetical protein